MAGRLQSADAKDLTQAFFVRFLEKRLIEQLDPERGSFRGFLKRSLRNFIIDEARKRSARSPADGKVFSYEEEQDAAQLPTEVESAEAEFEREWRVTVIWRALKALDKRLEKSGLGGHYVTFKSYCLPDGDLSRSQLLGGIQPANRLTYAELAKQLDLTPTGVRHQLAYCRQELRQIVEQEVRQYVLHEQDVASELKFLLGG